MRPTDPLPRSLIPLPGESLHGLVLRLSHRLGQSPGHILWYTGLGTAGRQRPSLAPNRLLFMLDRGEGERFAEATRLDQATVDKLTLRSYFAAHPTVTEALGRPGQPVRARTRLATWLMFSTPRYCPQCLAGDGSVIQRRHGGAWQLQWHLPIVFACLEHRVFLQHYCPGCQQPEDGARSSSSRFIASPAVAGLHPAQCRTNLASGRRGRICGHRLDSSNLPDVQLTPALQQLQPELLGLLNHAADPRGGLRRLSDLRVMAAIVSATWPHSLRGDIPTGLIDALDTDSIRRNQPGRDGEYGNRRWDIAPASAPAAAAVFSIAVHLLKLPLSDLRTELHALAEHAPSILDPAWGITWNLLHGDYSPTLRFEFKEAFTRPSPKYLEPTPSERARIDYLRRAKPLLAIRHEYQPKHIPQYLPSDWIDVLTEGSTPRPLPRSLRLRRVAAVQLVQIATGMSMPDASAFLHLPDTWLRGRAPQVPPLPRYVFAGNFNVTRAFEALVAYIGRTSDPVDYRERRERFRSWRLTQDTWDTLTSELPGRPSVWCENTRRACSAVIWAHLTGSEWRLSPDAGPLPLTSDGKRTSKFTLIELSLTKMRRASQQSGSVWEVLTNYAESLIANG
ncbi:TniQ family protein [Streptomyces sp. NPDC005708]|uniref:TniQ family protein n=1 Tax=Streptomyces sp. NPDC005708 TaxID=3154564 RepID=UPI003411BBAB